MCFQMISIYNLENAGRKLKPYHKYICMLSFVVARMCSRLTPGGGGGGGGGKGVQAA